MARTPGDVTRRLTDVLRRSPLAAAAGLAAAQGLALTVLCIAFGVEVLVGRPHDAPTAFFSFGLGVLAAVVLISLARPLRSGRFFARSPVVLLELLALPISAGLLQAGRYGYGVAVGLPALLVLGLLAAPSARRPFERRA